MGGPGAGRARGRSLREERGAGRRPRRGKRGTCASRAGLLAWEGSRVAGLPAEGAIWSPARAHAKDNRITGEPEGRAEATEEIEVLVGPAASAFVKAGPSLASGPCLRQVRWAVGGLESGALRGNPGTRRSLPALRGPSGTFKAEALVLGETPGRIRPDD